MLTELIHFSNSLSDEFKSIGLVPKEGLHTMLDVLENGQINTQADSINYEYYSKKSKEELSSFLDRCKVVQENAWCVNTNKCFDLPMKAMHTCSPFVMAFKREHLEGGAKHKANIEKDKPQIHERFEAYFQKAENLLPDEDERKSEIFQSFRSFIILGGWEVVLNDIIVQRDVKYRLKSEKLESLTEELKSASKDKKVILKEQIVEAKQALLKIQPLSDGDYILFYLNLPLEDYKTTHKVYLDDKLFNTDKYNTEPNDEGVIYGTNDFQNGFNAKMPFLMHQSASFDISGRISNLDAKALYELGKVLPRKSLPNPLPIFIYQDELFDNKRIALYKDGKIAYRELFATFYEDYEKQFQNYYLLNWSNTKDGIVFNDYDFVPKFSYKLNGQTGIEILNLFGIIDGETKQKKQNLRLYTVFDLEDRVLKYLIQNKYHRVDYFSDFKKEEYDNKDSTYLSYTKYRKAVYDYVYKCNRQSVGGSQFDEMVFNAIKDDIKNSNSYGVKDKLNIWYSLHNFFHQSNELITMASRLKDYQTFVSDTIEKKADPSMATDEMFAFSAGQVVYYLLDKSRSDDTSFRLLEPYLQKTNCDALKQAITNDFARYKHENFSNNFKEVSAFVLSYHTDANLKTLQPEFLSGVFSNNQLFSKSKNQ